MVQHIRQCGEHKIKWTKTGTEIGWNFTPNSVRIHTPIHNELIITSPSTNELLDESLAYGNKIVTLDDEFTATVELNGNSYYYTPITTALKKYVKEVYIECEICGKKTNGYVHNCKVPVTKEDNKLYKITSTVIAKNICSGGETENNTINNPDNIYTIKQTKEVYVVGRLYGLQLRTIDDIGWKLRKAETLAKLPTGEYKDNAISAYKYGVKLGYRAYFDLKTLGTATDSIKIIPKIYYITKERRNKR